MKLTLRYIIVFTGISFALSIVSFFISSDLTDRSGKYFMTSYVFYNVLSLAVVSSIAIYYINKLITRPVAKMEKGEFNNKQIDGYIDGFSENVKDIKHKKIEDYNKTEDYERIIEEYKNREMMNKALVDAIPDMMFRVNKEGVYLDFKADVESKLIMKAEDLIGSNIQNLPIDQKIRDGVMNCVREAIKTDEIQIYEYELDVPEGKSIFESRFVKSGTNEVVCIVRDITKKKNYEKDLALREEMLDTFFRSSPAGMALLDKDYNYIKINERLASINGFTAQEHQGKNIRDILPEELANIAVSLLKDVLVNGAFYNNLVIEGPHPSIENETGYWNVSYFPVPGENGSMSAGVVAVDLTGTKQAELVIEHQVDQLKKVNMELEEFNYIVSHDLSEPIRTMVSYSELLKRDMGEKLPERAGQDIHFIIDAANRMHNVVNDLLSLSRAGRIEMKYDPFDLNDCVKNIMNDLKLVISEVKGKVKWNGLCEIYGDKAQISRVLQNLVSNALKFHGDKIPFIEITSSENEKEWLISVSDNGIGIAEEYLDTIFLPFKRLHSMAKYKGSGIGLAICKKIVERHGGRFMVESTIGQGCTFSFSVAKKKITNENSD